MITKQQIGLLQSSKYIEILFSRRVGVFQIHLQFTIENRLLVMKTWSVPVSVPILLAQQNHVKFQILLVDNKLHQRLKFTCTQKLFHCFAHFYCTTVLYNIYIGFYSCCCCCCCWFGHQLSSMCVWCFIGKMKLTMITRIYHYCTLGASVIVFVFMSLWLLLAVIFYDENISPSNNWYYVSWPIWVNSPNAVIPIRRFSI